MFSSPTSATILCEKWSECAQDQTFPVTVFAERERDAHLMNELRWVSGLGLASGGALRRARRAVTREGDYRVTASSGDLLGQPSVHVDL